MELTKEDIAKDALKVLAKLENEMAKRNEFIKAMIEAEVTRQLEARFAGARAYVESVRHTFGVAVALPSGEVAVHRSIVSNRQDHEPKEAA